MKIQYLGHSAFLLETAGGTRIVTDPYGDVGFFMPHISADGVTVSHDHYDHNYVHAVDCGVVFDREGSFTLGDVEITAVPCFHDEVRGAKRGKNLAFVFRAEGLSLCHLGDLGEPCSEELINKLRGVDILLIPVGGNYTIDAFEAKRYVDAIKPHIVIPMHFKTENLTVDIEGPERFLAYFEDAEHAGSRIALARADFREKTRIICMERE